MAGQSPNDPDSGLVTLSGVVFTDDATTAGHPGSKHLTFRSAVGVLKDCFRNPGAPERVCDWVRVLHDSVRCFRDHDSLGRWDFTC
jgi:hypothetical protein